ncbi:YgiQ family radical SAM protein [Proteocatella sphenisci]|uniref:YgiQ family radical SAM protein n=1 Tax=Proteocatella sphenisci TaxID=181070 RepID=UPI0004AE41AB|nr:YgiQ family radical SAM protein [Proteocatella sphenisci]
MNNKLDVNTKFLPLNKKEANLRGGEQVDFVLVTGDAYVDHPSFGTALIGRILEKEGFSVGIISQPDWRQDRSIKIFGEPRLAFLVGSGNIDSMVNNYTASKKPRRTDGYSPGGNSGLRPDRALSVYVKMVKSAYPDSAIVIGGIEASLRRFAHYDYWSDSVMPSILVDTKADMLMYGMSENQIKTLAQGLAKGWPIHKIKDIQGTCYLSKDLPKKNKYTLLSSFEEVTSDKIKFAETFQIQSKEQNPFIGQTLVQKHGDEYLIQLPPTKPLSQTEMDEIYNLPFTRTYHPRYKNAGGIPALQEVEFSVTDHRGCFGGCSFCAISFHQGRIIQNRSEESVLKEIQLMTKQPTFKGYIHDIGGPTANFRNVACKKQLTSGACKDKQCLDPIMCPSLEIDHSEYLSILRKARRIDKVKKVFIRSGVRFDYLMADKNTPFLEEMCEFHISGQLKVAPEHVSPNALKYMGKPDRKVYDNFVDKYKKTNEKLEKKQYLVPYFISSHPGCTLDDAILLAEYTRDMGHNPEQVQDFIPTPGSLSTAMYYSEVDPRTLKPIFVAKSQKDKSLQRALLQYRNPKNYELVYEALKTAGREDLIGHGPNALIKPKKRPYKK